MSRFLHFIQVIPHIFIPKNASKTILMGHTLEIWIFSSFHQVFPLLHLGSLNYKNQFHTHCDKKLPIASEVGFAASCTTTKSLRSREPTENHLVAGTHTNISLFGISKFCGRKLHGTTLSEMIIEEISIKRLLLISRL